MSPPITPVAQRLARHADMSGGLFACWPWQSVVGNRGYGLIRECGATGRMLQVHRVAYAATHGPIPAGLTIDHLCRNRLCVNPAHLEAVPLAVNVARGNVASAAERSHCGRGHQLPPYKGRPRRCATCIRERHTEYMRGYRRRAAA